MKNPTVPALALAGLMLAGSAWAGERQPTPAPNGKPVVREKIVIVDKDGKEHVYDSEGTPVRRGYLGVGLTELTPELRAHFGAPEDAGVMVSSVEDGSPADKAGVKVGDIIRRVNGTPIRDVDEAYRALFGANVGDTITLTVERDGKSLTMKLLLLESPE